MVMARGMKAALLLAVGALADHPCVNEVASACPDRPGSDVAACLKDSSEHDSATEISSECTDFIALNKACAADIEAKCDGALFSDDTIPCLTQWTEKEDLSERCQKVVSWAVPQEEEGEEAEAPTNELGMTEEEAKEKEEWRAKRKAVRTEAIDRMKMKDVDKKAEEDRIALEEFKEKDPEGYAQMVQQQEEEKKQKAKFAQMERQRAAALERKKKQDAGLNEEDDAPKKKKKQEEESSFSGSKGKKKGGSWLYSIFSLAFVGLVVYGVYMLMSGPSGGPRKSGGSGKKRR